MVLLSESCRGGISSLLLAINKVLFFHHDIDSPVITPRKQFNLNVCPSCRSVNTLIGYKSFSATNYKDN